MHVIMLLGCGPLSVERFTASSGGNGVAAVEVDIAGEASFLVSAESDKILALERLIDPKGNVLLHWADWYDASESLTYAFFAESTDTFFNWPVRKADGALSDGTYTVELGVYDGDWTYASNQDVDITLHRKVDEDLSSATYNIVMVFTDTMYGDDTVREGVDAAVAHWRDVWSAAGLDFNLRTKRSGIDDELPYPGYGDDEMVKAHKKARRDEVVVVVGEKVGPDNTVYGMAGGIPGPLIGTNRTGTVISWLAHAGGDGKLSKNEAQVMGETMAHEVGHYVGLFHPVEDGWEYWDALDDTLQCTSQNQCETQLGDNFMFPYSICDWTSCQSAWKITDEQAGVMQRYVAAL